MVAAGGSGASGGAGVGLGVDGQPTFSPERVERFRYLDVDFNARSGVLRCRYALDDEPFEERITFQSGAPRSGASQPGSSDPPGLEDAARLVFLLAGISYYKAAAPLRVEVPLALSPAERALLERCYFDGLGEYAFRNGLDLNALHIEAPHAAPGPVPVASSAHHPLIPFGGGIDSIVTVEGLRRSAPSAALFVVSREGDRFDAIEDAAAVTGLAVVRAERRLDPKILRSAARGYRNGHVPVTAMISAIAVMAAVLDGRDAVVMSNEQSASSGNVMHHGRMVNHQWSKTLAFEDLLRASLAEALPTPMAYFSWLRPFSELWVAQRFAQLPQYHGVFRSCNRAFHIDRAARLDHWCGTCDKCCFVDLVLSPFMSAAALRNVFNGNEPLDDPGLLNAFRTLTGLSGEIKPFECVGDVDECVTAATSAAGRPDRAGSAVLGPLAAELTTAGSNHAADPTAQLRSLLQPQGPHRIPSHHAPSDLLD
ncbi:MAG: hypothetical protein ACKV2O_21360 [Acidimicrobiales bacterium]